VCVHLFNDVWHSLFSGSTISAHNALTNDIQACCNLPAVLITLHGNPTDVHSRRRQVLVPQRILRLDDAAGLFGNYPRERVTRLVDMNLLNTGRASVALQVF
jgi:hypothetical protein